MKKEELYEVMNDIEDVYIMEASLLQKKKRSPVGRKWPVLAACICILVAVSLMYPYLVSVPIKQYKRISFQSESLGEGLADHLTADTAVLNLSEEQFSTQLPIYRIKERNITQQDYEQMLAVLELPENPHYLELEGNYLNYDLASYTDISRGYFDMTNEEVEALAWEIFNQIPFLEGVWDCIGIRETFTISDSAGTHISRVGVEFCRLLDEFRVIGAESCMLLFDGSGLVEIRIKLFDYTKIGTMNLVALEDAAERIKTPDGFVLSEDTGVVETLSVERVKLLLVNQFSNGCWILQPIYNFIGTATLTDGTKVEFQSRVIAIPESYTHE